MASISIVLKAVDQYSGVITGLNQGFELAAKAVDALKWTADAAFSAIASGAELISKGGAFREQESQFKNLAQAYSQNADEIVDAIKRISNNSVNLSDAVKIGTKAIVTGLSGPEIESTLKFVKKFTEATGEDFNAMSEQVFKSLSSGKFAVLKQFGLMAERGAQASDIVSQMAEKISLFGDAAFNAGDNFGALSIAQDDFLTKIGAAINDVPALEEALTSLTRSALDFVYSFDTRQITNFVEYSARLIQALYNSFVTSFSDIAFTVYESLKSISESFTILKNPVEIIKFISGAFLNFGAAVSRISGAVIFAMGYIGEGLSSLYSLSVRVFANFGEMLYEQLLKPFESVVAILNKLNQNVIISTALGPAMSGLISELAAFTKLDANQVKDWKVKLDTEDNLGDFFGELSEKAQDLGVDLYDKSYGAFAKFANDVDDIFDNIKYPDLALTKDNQGRSKEQLDAIRKMIDTQNRETDAAKKTNKVKSESNRLERQSIKNIKDIADSADILSDSTAKIADSVKDISGGIAGTIDLPGIRKLERSYDTSAAGVLRLMEDSKARDEEIFKKYGIRSYRSSMAPIQSATMESAKIIQRTVQELQKNQIAPMETKQKTLKEEITDYLAATNWPAELQALGEFLLGFIIAKSRNERIPLTVSTF